MQRLEVSSAVRPIYGSLGVKRLIRNICCFSTVTMVVKTRLIVTVYVLCLSRFKEAVKLIKY
jgi:hypothetical protein